MNDESMQRLRGSPTSKAAPFIKGLASLPENHASHEVLDDKEQG